ncbi:MAG TPA: NADH pyrophosphatase zinc ribbon domain-containing protein [Paludibacter sp.]|nr:NADH pyrophosphatase zinc ribbon domain-containing protein [Paludibacter sp.]
MIHEIFPHQLDNHFVITNNIVENDYILQYNEHGVLLKVDGGDFELPRKKDVSTLFSTAESTYLFMLNDVRCFLVWDKPKTANDQFVYKDISFLRNFKPKEIAWVGVVGFQLKNWYSQNKFCGTCGSETHEKSDERAIVCPSCNTIVFPKISPAIVVAILCKDKILLAHNSNFQDNWYLVSQCHIFTINV